MISLTVQAPSRPASSMHQAEAKHPARRLVGWVRRGGLSTLLFFLPLLLSFGLFSWWPILRSLPLSVQQTNFLTTEWVGFSNFTRVLADPLLLTAAWNTLWFALLALAIGFPLPVLLAIFIAEMRRTRGLASALAYLPVIFPPVVAVLLWKAFFDPSPTGVLNTVLGWAGLGPLAWLNDGDLAMPSIVLQATWASFGTATIIYLATLMGVQSELYDAAESDGAGAFKRFWHVTLPQMRGVLLVMMLLQLIGTFQVFTEPYIMTNGGPENRTVTILMLIYRYAFVSGDYGRATALSVLLAIALSALSGIYLWSTRRWSTS
ncbi:carbohydrate ABC transporter permease [Dactylosporangium sp. CA-233914]|uniref:carbohydrate ABC transporter permease n=1 Tax=Dactylosporangium sp. CA-233914 TaxID=3239934 RepID=UPI003D8E6AB5